VSVTLGAQKYDKMRVSVTPGAKKCDKMRVSVTPGAQKCDKIRVSTTLGAQNTTNTCVCKDECTKKQQKIRVSGSAENHSRLSSYTELFLGPEDGFSCHFTRSRHLGLDEVHLLRSDSVGRDFVIPS
jgi:hypothetical protein